jgi:hypothetical protein
MYRYHQEEFNGLMRGYYEQFGKRKICKHTPRELLIYRLSLVLNLAVLLGFVLKHL